MKMKYLGILFLISSIVLISHTSKSSIMSNRVGDVKKDSFGTKLNKIIDGIQNDFMDIRGAKKEGEYIETYDSKVNLPGAEFGMIYGQFEKTPWTYICHFNSEKDKAIAGLNFEKLRGLLSKNLGDKYTAVPQTPDDKLINGILFASNNPIGSKIPGIFLEESFDYGSYRVQISFYGLSE